MCIKLFIERGESETETEELESLLKKLEDDDEGVERREGS
jgi:hypothetical protein